MAVRDRLLNFLAETKNALDENNMQKAAADIKKARALSEKGLTKEFHEPYKETYDVMITALSDSHIQLNDVAGLLKELLRRLTEDIRHEKNFKKEMAFLPYRASMWDSLESVWRMASSDEDHCIAYVIPIPYVELGSNETVTGHSCDLELFPKNIPVLDYHDINLEEMHPDVIFVHNPYDNNNYVTTVESEYYSDNLKKWTDLLVYIPYYATSGGMADWQQVSTVYDNSDYIVIQSPHMRGFFSDKIPNEKFLPFGSPKFDKTIALCKNPPPPPAEWADRIKGRRVYFYNTSLNGILGETEAFLQKMAYVFNEFLGRDDVCLIWRPHPVMDATLKALREPLFPVYENLRQQFKEKNVGIYDDTPDIEKTIALSDAYIGDSATSVVSLFAVAGKPMFIHNNCINTRPEKGDFVGGIVWGFLPDRDNKWYVSANNSLWHLENGRYRHVCALSKYNSGSYYMAAFEIGGEVYVCPANARDIVVVSGGRVVRRIMLGDAVNGRPGAFANAWRIDSYIFLIPSQFPIIIRLDTRNGEVRYIKGLNPFFVKYFNIDRRVGASCVWRKNIVISAPDVSAAVIIDAETMNSKIVNIGAKTGGYCDAAVDGDDIWFMPYSGKSVVRWNPVTGEFHEYEAPENFVCHNITFGFECDDFPFGHPAFDDESAIFPPGLGNMFIRIDKKTGKVSEWKPKFKFAERFKNGYFYYSGFGGFIHRVKGSVWRFFHGMSRELYDVNIKNGKCKQVKYEFDEREVRNCCGGFTELSEWLKYGCEENAFNTLGKFISGEVVGEQFDHDRQIKNYEEVAVNLDGSCGEKVYHFIMDRLAEMDANPTT